ncbi:MAG: hypothetical protein K1X53_03370 [Candidatus Sumerlaeaceae bacterium]|nr:hypothetical protein [Candidatus Sumerlaeaceae bacterium]
MSFSFPIFTDANEDWPKESKCPVCGKSGIFEPNSFAVLSGGAISVGDNPVDCACEWGGFLDIFWHGAHTDLGGNGANPDMHVGVPIAESDKSLQFCLYFCSTTCLRSFLNTWVDRLEEGIRNYVPPAPPKWADPGNTLVEKHQTPDGMFTLRVEKSMEGETYIGFEGYEWFLTEDLVEMFVDSPKDTAIRQFINDLTNGTLYIGMVYIAGRLQDVIVYDEPCDGPFPPYDVPVQFRTWDGGQA